MKIVLTRDNPLTNQATLVAQIEAELLEPEDSEVPNVLLSDTTRLGPYSVLLKDAFEASQSEQLLLLDPFAESADMVAIARSLTPEERAQGLNQQLVTREKIALIVDVNNPFQGTLTLAQVQGIFRGEITNWKQVGGSDRPLQLVHRPARNLTRLALKEYGLTINPTLSEATPPDTTAALIEQLGENGISYAPASETIEQFNILALTIDNVGVNDGRYPYSQPLNYVFQAQPKPEVQGFLEFLQSPDAQAAIEFAQSQPADSTRTLIPSNLSAIPPSDETGTTVSGDLGDSETQPTSPSPSGTDTVSEIPLQAQNPQSPDPAPSGNALSWLPLLFIFAGLGLLSWLTYMRVKLEANRKNTPRPAPNYAARLSAQGSNRNKEELRAIAEGPAKAKAAAASTARLVTPDFSLDSGTPELEENPQETLDDVPSEIAAKPDVVSIESESQPLRNPNDVEEIFDQDMTTLQAKSPVVADSMADLELEDMTTLQSAPIDEDMTTLQAVPTDNVLGGDGERLDIQTDSSEDASVLQGVFEPQLPVPEEPQGQDEEIETFTLGEEETDTPQRDTLTGQLTDELETLSELEAAENARQEQLALEQAETDVERSRGERWDEIVDPWD